MAGDLDGSWKLCGGVGPPLVFPATATCLWDRRPVGEPVEASVDGNCWVRVRASQSVLRLALRAGQQASHSPLHCLLLGSAFVSERGGVVVEVDRFDLGRDIGSGLQPTALVPGDIIIFCTVGSWRTTDVTESWAEEDLQQRLEASPLPAPDLLHLQLHISPPHSASAQPNPIVSLTCRCVYPSSCYLTPVTVLPIVPTALARNLAGPLPLSVLQATVKWGYLTMEVSRKLVVLLPSDPKSRSVLLVGVWVSGVSRCAHPAVWAALLHYKHSTALARKAGEGCLCLVYSGDSQPSLFEFDFATQSRFTYSAAEVDTELCSDSAPPILELVPGDSPALTCPKGRAMANPHLCGRAHRATAPQPSPLPTLAKVSQLSSISLVEKTLHNSFSSEQYSRHTLSTTALTSTSTVLPSSAPSQRLTVFPEKQVEPQVLGSSEQQIQYSEVPTLRKTPTTEKATNTGISLLLLGAPAASLEGSEEVSRDSGAEASGVSMNTMTTREVSIKTESSVQASGPINLDLCSFATGSLQNKSIESEEMCTQTERENSCLLLSSRQFYQNMLESVQELLQTPVEREQVQSVYHGNGNHRELVDPELSMFPIPHITAITSCSEATLDETAHAADVITMKYVDNHSDITGLETESCLQRHQLLPHPPNSHILDLGRLRSLPKLL